MAISSINNVTYSYPSQNKQLKKNYSTSAITVSLKKDQISFSSKIPKGYDKLKKFLEKGVREKKFTVINVELSDLSTEELFEGIEQEKKNLANHEDVINQKERLQWQGKNDDDEIAMHFHKQQAEQSKKRIKALTIQIKKKFFGNTNNKQLFGLDKVAGMEDLKKTLRQDVIEPLQKPELYTKYGLNVVNGFLLYGPPGCGKTYISKMLAEETERYFVEITPSNIGSKYQHESAENIAKKFAEARANAPSIVFIDEIEALAPVRANLAGENPDSNEQVTEFLLQMNKSNGNDVLIVTASNEPQKIDPAIKRTGRLDKKIFVGPPDEKSRLALMIKQLQDRYIEYDINLDDLVNKTKFYTAEDIRVLVDNAAKKALANEKPISMADLISELEIMQPSLKETDIKKYKDKILL